METRGKDWLFGLAVSFVNTWKGCTWVPLTGWCQSGGLWSPFGKYRKESANSPEDSVNPRDKGPETWAVSFSPLQTLWNSHLFIFFFLRKKENNKKASAQSSLGPQEGTPPMWFSHFQVFGWWIRLSRNAPSPDNNTFRCRIRSVWIKTRRWMINIFAYRGRHGSFLHLNEKPFSLHLYVCICLQACAFRRQEQRVSSLAVISKYRFLPLTWSTQEVLEGISCEAEVWR